MTIETLPQKRRMSLDEILDHVTEVARDPEAGADRFRALKMLATTESASVVMPEPQADGEVVERLARVMKGAGARLTQAAYGYAFPNANRTTVFKPKPEAEDATPEMRFRAKRITSLKMLNKAYPEAKIRGVPRGFPSGRSIAIKAAWCQDQALKLEVERAARERADAQQALADGDAVVRNDKDVVDGPLHSEGSQ